MQNFSKSAGQDPCCKVSQQSLLQGMLMINCSIKAKTPGFALRPLWDLNVFPRHSVPWVAVVNNYFR
jgi:hypothetical protein